MPVHINPDADWSGVTHSPYIEFPATIRECLEAIRDSAKKDDPTELVHHALEILNKSEMLETWGARHGQIMRAIIEPREAL